jgi:hypothetical protein
MNQLILLGYNFSQSLLFQINLLDLSIAFFHDLMHNLFFSDNTVESFLNHPRLEINLVINLLKVNFLTSFALEYLYLLLNLWDIMQFSIPFIPFAQFLNFQQGSALNCVHL